MNRNHLALFRAVAEHGTITAAARSLHISQPAVSSQISALERQVGAKLFDRLPRGARLTAVGEVLYRYAQRIGHLEEETKEAIRDFLGLRQGRLAVGASTSIGSYLLPEVMGDVALQHPGLVLSLRIDNTEGIQQALLDGTLDIGLTEGFASGEDFDVSIFQEDELSLIAPPGHALTGLPRVTLNDTLQYPLLVRETGSGTRAIVENALVRQDVDPTPSMSLGSSEALKRAVAAGLGIAWVSRLALGNELALGMLEVVDVMDFSLRRPLHRLLVRGRTPSPATLAFESILRGVAATSC
ncbi:MAG: LysR family transcriptional regulator [Thermoanaerobaculia bacterium]|nr:LysR family transcriptional regulator [Thermoanaerobaculia bacterium]